MLPSHIGSGDPGPRAFLQDPQFLVDGIPSAALNTRINLNSFCIRRHSRMTRLTPSSDLRRHCPVEIGAAPQAKREHLHRKPLVKASIRVPELTLVYLFRSHVRRFRHLASGIRGLKTEENFRRINANGIRKIDRSKCS
jgi:hypothetical protein